MAIMRTRKTFSPRFRQKIPNISVRNPLKLFTNPNLFGSGRSRSIFFNGTEQRSPGNKKHFYFE